MKSRPSAKKLGFKKGDFVWTGIFPGIVVSQVHTSTPVCEVWGIEHESGGVYSTDLKKIGRVTFNSLVAQQGHTLPLNPHFEVARDALKGAA